MWNREGGFLFKKKPGKIVPPPHSPNPSSAASDGKVTALPDYVTSKAHHAGKGYYVNPWPSAQPKGGWFSTGFQIPLAWSQVVHPSIRRITTVKPDFHKVTAANELKATWLGHAGVLVQLPPLKAGTDPITLLVDPIFSERASPSQYAGPIRRLPAPCKIEDLPHIDFVFTSHNHYDHLDVATMEKLVKRGGSHTRYVIPLGLKQWFFDMKVPNEQIIEQDWWEEVTIQPSEINDRPDEMDELGSLRISCVPAQHNSARTGWDKSTSLWCGYVIEQFACRPSEAPTRTSVYFAGDTGYRAETGGACCPAFEQIGERYGPMDFSTIPIWRGGTLAFVSYLGLRLHPEALTRYSHATPEDAVAIHCDVKSRASMPIHYAVWSGSEDEATYPLALLQEACADVNIEMDLTQDRGMGPVDNGQTVKILVREG